MHNEKTIEQVLAEHTAEWMAIPGVEGTALGEHDDRPYIVVLTSVDPEQLRTLIPETVHGYPVILEDTGEIRALEYE